jgi:tetraacyldisaccharide 4'-kinase
VTFAADPDWEVLYPPGVAAGSRAARAQYGRYLMPALVPASWAYQVVSNAVRGVRSAATDAAPAGVLVASVGNLEVGGSGKTPLAMDLVARLAARGESAVYISRGFGGQAERLDAVTVVPPATGGRFSPVTGRGVRYLHRNDPHLARLVGDEGAMVAGRVPEVPLLFCRRKSLALEAAVTLFHPTHAVMDDAFQSWGVPRDVDIVVVNGAAPFADGWLLPAGRLREPPEALERADAVGINVEDRRELEGARALIAATAGLTRPSFGIYRRLSFDPGDHAPVAVLSGIARPDAFERALSRAGTAVSASFRFPDHHPYTDRDLQWVLDVARTRGVGRVLTTEKDWVKLSRLGPPPGRFDVVRLSLEFIDGDPLDRMKKAAG